MDNQFDFSEISPIEDKDFKAKMAELVKEPGFEHAVRYVMPGVDYPEFVKVLLQVPDKKSFQLEIMRPFLEMLAKRTTAGISLTGIENIDKDKSYTFMSNHRDIVLDASFLNVCLIRAGFPTSEIAIGSNLLIYDWITDLVKLNKSFIVKRGLPMIKALEAAKQLSAYISYAINEKHQSVWIAQREGRAKDSNDMTQESLVKMLSLEPAESKIDNIRKKNIVPVSISYEFDPNDYLKAREFLMKKLDPEFKKSQHDDLLSMETGLLQNKGRVHFHIGQPIDSEIDSIPDDAPRADILPRICHIIDCSIHSGYHIYPINYIAYDIVHKQAHFSDRYTAEQLKEVENYVEAQLDKVRWDGPMTKENRDYMREMMYVMYSNPLRNKLSADNRC